MPPTTTPLHQDRLTTHGSPLRTRHTTTLLVMASLITTSLKTDHHTCLRGLPTATKQKRESNCFQFCICLEHVVNHAANTPHAKKSQKLNCQQVRVSSITGVVILRKKHNSTCTCLGLFRRPQTSAAKLLLSHVAGVVMGCPSDSPDDYTALNELKAKPAFRQKFHVQDAWVEYDVSDMAVVVQRCCASQTALDAQACPALPCPALPCPPVLPCAALPSCSALTCMSAGPLQTPHFAFHPGLPRPLLTALL